MTRINVVPPRELTRLHLVAEYRELPRIFGLVRAKQNKGITPQHLKIPSEYTLGTGHMLFFYNKCYFLLHRQQALINEMISRGFTPKFTQTTDLVAGLEDHWLGHWEPTEAAMLLNRRRITERLNG